MTQFTDETKSRDSVNTTSAFNKEEKFSKLNEVVKNIRNKHKLFGIVDIVLNHTANNS